MGKRSPTSSRRGRDSVRRWPTSPIPVPSPTWLRGSPSRRATCSRRPWPERDPGVGGTLDLRSKSSPTDWVTEWDQASERLIRERIGAVRPDDGILGEEEGDTVGTSAVRWVVDPIDGTTNFVYGLPPFAVSIAAEVDGEVVAGAVADVLHREVYVASAGGRGDVQRGGRSGSATAPSCPTPWSAPGSPTTPGAGATRPRCSSRSCPTSGTCAGAGRRRWTCAGSPAGDSTPTGSGASGPGTTPPAPSSPARPARWSATCAAARSRVQMAFATTPAIAEELRALLRAGRRRRSLSTAGAPAPSEAGVSSVRNPGFGSARTDSRAAPHRAGPGWSSTRPSPGGRARPPRRRRSPRRGRRRAHRWRMGVPQSPVHWRSTKA